MATMRTVKIYAVNHDGSLEWIADCFDEDPQDVLSSLGYTIPGRRLVYIVPDDIDMDWRIIAAFVVAAAAVIGWIWYFIAHL